MKRLFVGLLFAAGMFAAEVTVIRVPLCIPGLPYLPGFIGQVEVFVQTDARAVRVTVQTAGGALVVVTDAWEGQALAVFPVADIIGVPVVEELR